MNRYIGDSPNNYVTFNNETWRIIGVFTTENSEGNTEQRIKLIRGEKLPSNMQWDYNNVNEWPTSSLNTYLNGEYLTSLTDDAKSMIDNVKYYLGGSSTNQSGPSYYNFERGTAVYSGHSTNTINKIGLMYVSDYVYTYSLGVDNKCYTRASDCSTAYRAVPTAGWIYSSNSNSTQWTLAPCLDNGDYDRALFMYSYGDVSNHLVNDSHGVRPVLYLKSDIQIDKGNGTEESPYEFKL